VSAISTPSETGGEYLRSSRGKGLADSPGRVHAWPARQPRLVPCMSVPEGADGRTRICIVGPSTRFLSGISYYTIAVANGLSEIADVSVLFLRQLLPASLYPGNKRVGKQLTDA